MRSRVRWKVQNDTTCPKVNPLDIFLSATASKYRRSAVNFIELDVSHLRNRIAPLYINELVYSRV